MESILSPPQIQVKLNDSPLDARAMADLSSFTVEHGSGLISKFTLVLRTWNSNTRRYTWVDAPLFKLGGKVEIKMSAGTSRPELLLLGEITDLELRAEAGGPPVLEVSGLDPRHVLAREHKSRRFKEKTLVDLSQADSRFPQFLASSEMTPARWAVGATPTFTHRAISHTR